MQTILSIKQSSRNLSAFNAQVNSQIQILTSPGSSAVKRHDAIITLGSLLGVHYFSFSQTTNSYFFTSSSSTTITQVLDTLRNIAGLDQETSISMMSDVKGGRLDTFVLSCLMQIVARISEIGNEFSGTFVTSSTELKDYPRLPMKSYFI